MDDINDQAIWIRPRDDVQLIWRKGMEAPGTNGARFEFFAALKFNDSGEIAFLAALVREGGIDHTNDNGIWSGSFGVLELVVREGDPAWNLGKGIFVLGIGTPSFNAEGDVGAGLSLSGDAVSADNDVTRWVRTSEKMVLITREGDPVPALGDEITFGPGLQARGRREYHRS